MAWGLQMVGTETRFRTCPPSGCGFRWEPGRASILFFLFFFFLRASILSLTHSPGQEEAGMGVGDNLRDTGWMLGGAVSWGSWVW